MKDVYENESAVIHLLIFCLSFTVVGPTDQGKKIQGCPLCRIFPSQYWKQMPPLVHRMLSVHQEKQIVQMQWLHKCLWSVQIQTRHLYHTSSCRGSRASQPRRWEACRNHCGWTVSSEHDIKLHSWTQSSCGGLHKSYTRRRRSTFQHWWVTAHEPHSQLRSHWQLLHGCGTKQAERPRSFSG